MLSQESTHHLSAQEHSGLLSLLAQDDRFRAELTQNPAETLGRFGIQLQEMPNGITLPSKEVLDLQLGSWKNDSENNPERPPWGSVHV